MTGDRLQAAPPRRPTARRVALRQLLGLGFAAAATGLSGCATRRPDGGAPWTSGRLSLRAEATGDRPAQSLSATFELRGDGRRGELRLSTPLGTQLAAARWAPGEAVLLTPQGERRFETLEALSREALGEPLPLAALPDWLAGRPWDGAGFETRADGFEQLGWQVQTDQRAAGSVSARRSLPAPALLLRVRIDDAG